MTKDAKSSEKQRLAEALRANLRRRKAAQGARAERESAAGATDGTRETRTDNVK